MNYKFIIFLGIDGSGKSTLTNLTYQMIKANSSSKVRCIWFRSYLQICLSNLITKHRKKDNPTRKKDKNPSILRKLIWESYMYIVLLDYFFIMLLFIRIPILFGYTIISDRYIYDVILDLSAHYNYSEKKISKLINTRFFLLPDRIYYINVPAKIAQSRRPEHSVEELDLKLRYFDYFNSNFRHSNNTILLDGTKNLSDLSVLINNSLIHTKEVIL